MILLDYAAGLFQLLIKLDWQIILTLLDTTWNNVSGIDNPTGCASRAVSDRSLMDFFYGGMDLGVLERYFSVTKISAILDCFLRFYGLKLIIPGIRYQHT